MKKKIWFLCILCLMLVMLLPLSASAEEKLKVYVHDSLTMLYEVVGGSGQHEIVTATLSDWSGVLVQSTSLPISYPFEDDISYTLTITVRDLVTGETVTGSIWNTYEDPSYEYWCSQGDHNDYESEDEGGWGFNTWTVSSEYFDITDTHHSVKGVEAYRCIDCNAYMYSREFEYTRIHIIKPATGRCECGYDEKTVTNVPEGLFYKIENEAVTITGYKSKTNTLVIPAEIEGYPVTKIDRQAFRLCTSLTSITIPDSVTSIEEEAFSCCYGLTSITIPDNVTYIGKYAFSGCDSLTSITIPDSVTSIDTLSFYDCDSLNSITIPESVTYIGEEPFFGCENLALITVSPNNPAYTSVDGILFNKDKTVLIQYPAGKLSKSYTIPQGTQKIGNYAFELCSKLTSIIIPNSVTSIGYYAFTNCTSLTNIAIPNSVTSIGKCAFNYCHGLTSITIPSSVTSIGDWLFYFCGYQFTINVEQDSYAHQWCLENGYEDIVQFICADETMEELSVSIGAWQTDSAVSVSANAISVGATARIVGGSGDYTCEWSATSDNGKSSKKSITTTDSEVSWAINTYEPDTWKFTITVTDNETGKRASASSSITVRSERDKYLSLLRKYSKYDNPLDDPLFYAMAYDRLALNFSHERTKELLQIVHDAPFNYRTVYLYTLYDYEILSTDYDGDVSKYASIENGIFFKKNDIDNNRTFFHEHGHAIDSVSFLSLEYKDASTLTYYSIFHYVDEREHELRDYIVKDVEYSMTTQMIDHGVSEASAQKIAKAIISGNTSGLSTKEKEEMEKVPGYYANYNTLQFGNADTEIYGSLSDIFGGATGNYVLGYDWFSGGHETSYWEKDETRLAREFWAHYFSARIRNDQKELSVLYGMLAHSCEAMDTLVEILADDLVSKK